jgi:hypothetical protein
LPLLLILVSLLDQLGEILLLASNALCDLNNDAAALKLELFAIAKVVVLVPVHVADEVGLFVVHHDALVEGVVLELSILPSLLLSLQVMCEEAHVVENWCCGWDNGGGGRTHAAAMGGHGGRNGMSSSFAGGASVRMSESCPVSRLALGGGRP